MSGIPHAEVGCPGGDAGEFFDRDFGKPRIKTAERIFPQGKFRGDVISLDQFCFFEHLPEPVVGNADDFRPPQFRREPDDRWFRILFYCHANHLRGFVLSVNENSMRLNGSAGTGFDVNGDRIHGLIPV